MGFIKDAGLSMVVKFLRPKVPQIKEGLAMAEPKAYEFMTGQVDLEGNESHKRKRLVLMGSAIINGEERVVVQTIYADQVKIQPNRNDKGEPQHLESTELLGNFLQNVVSPSIDEFMANPSGFIKKMEEKYGDKDNEAGDTKK